LNERARVGFRGDPQNDSEQNARKHDHVADPRRGSLVQGWGT
jgi:hypothetical protein